MKKWAIRLTVALMLSALTTMVGGTSSAWAGSAGVDPSSCGAGATWSYTDFNINGAIMREELRHATGCGGVGWGRLTHVGGSSPTLALIQTAWNPGGPSQDGVSGTNWTYTVSANSGQQVCAGFQAYSVDNFGTRHYLSWNYAGCYTA